jgi:alpha,alpha-trehalose phosphorylase
MDVRNLERNVLDGVHVAALGGALIAVRAGLGGMRDWAGCVSFAPRLPADLDRVAFRVMLRGRCLTVEIRPDKASYSLRDGNSQVTVSHWGERIEVEPGNVTSKAIPPAPVLAAPSQPRGRAPRRRDRS